MALDHQQVRKIDCGKILKMCSKNVMNFQIKRRENIYLVTFETLAGVVEADAEGGLTELVEEDRPGVGGGVDGGQHGDLVTVICDVILVFTQQLGQLQAIGSAGGLEQESVAQL